MAKYGSYGRQLNNKQLAASILIKQCGRCAYCNTSLQGVQVHWDHFIPWSYLGYSGGDDNWVATCKMCNLKKSSKVFTKMSQVTKFCYEMVQSHGSLAEGWPEETETWQISLHLDSNSTPEPL